MIGMALQTVGRLAKKLWDDKKAEFPALIQVAVSLL
jgi:hypothetical protein